MRNAWVILCVILCLASVSTDESHNSTGEDGVTEAGNPGYEIHGSEDDHHDKNSSDEHHDGNHTEHHGHHGIHVASWNYDYVQGPLVIIIFLIITAICKLCFHQLEWLSSKVPESCLLILLGTLLGAILKYTSVGGGMMGHLEPRTFFLFLLPPIILESAFSLHDHVFFDNLGTILLYAVIGTLINWIVIGGALFGLSVGGAMGSGMTLGFIPSLVFSALIVAVDPVAVLAIFQEVGVNNVLYFLVFGESLLNDAVTVVIYNTMKTMNKMDEIGADQIVLAFVAFFTVSLGGLSIGILFGIFTAVLTRYTQKVKVVEPLAILSFAYASYLTAELFHFSGIISIIACGLMQAQYSFHNIGHKSLTTIKYFSKMISATCDCIIFMFLGISIVRADHEWNTGFILWTVFLCLLVRFIVVFGLTFIANKKRLRKISYEEQFIMAYGGLRGAIAFCLVAMLEIPEQNVFETATIVMILFTVFIQGITIKPFVSLLRIKKASKKKKTIGVEMNTHVLDHVVAGMEEIIGHVGHNSLRENFLYYDEKYFKVWLQRDPQSNDDYIMEVYKELTMHDHAWAVLQHYQAMAAGKCYYEKQVPLTPLTPATPGSGFSIPSAVNRMGGTEGSRQNLSFDRYLSIDTTHSDINHKYLDIQKGARKRNTNNRKSYPPSVGLNKNRQEFQRSVSQADPESAKQDITRKRSTLSRIFSRGVYDGDQDVIKEPTAEDFRRWVVKPVKQAMSQRHDKNLINDYENDIVHHLDQKRKRMQRMITSKFPCGSMPSVFEGYPGSMERLAASCDNVRVEHAPRLAAAMSLPQGDAYEMKTLHPANNQASSPKDANQNNRAADSDTDGPPGGTENDALLQPSDDADNGQAGSAKCKGKLTRQGATSKPDIRVEEV